MNATEAKNTADSFIVDWDEGGKIIEVEKPTFSAAASFAKRKAEKTGTSVYVIAVHQGDKFAQWIAYAIFDKASLEFDYSSALPVTH